jgi:cytochrome c oxidase assembly protein subunit 11|tara:strand:+ start:1734 stop:2222 length:489 start_codon:yes stop_codon:yes gene_type:complete
MVFIKNKYLKLFFILLFLITIFTIFENKFEKDLLNAEKPIIINLLTSVHPNLPWKFKALDSQIIVKPGEVTTIEYIVENLENKDTTGIATFAYFPNQFGAYIRKLNCFCYDAQTLKSKEKNKYSVVLLIDPEVTKDSKTKNIKEVTIQFNFFNYKEYKENKI